VAYFYNEPSRTFSEYLLLPNLTKKECIPEKVSLRTPVVRYKVGEKSSLEINLPVTSAIMQSVSDATMAIALARCGGLSFIFASQPIDKQVEMVEKVKKYKAGFVISTANLSPEHTLKDLLALKAKTGYSTVPVTEDGSAGGKLLGIVTSRDYRLSRTPLKCRLKEFMTPFDALVYGMEGISLGEANDMIWDHKLNCLPIITKDRRLAYLVFRKDYDDHKENPEMILDQDKRLVVGAGINSRDYAERVPALLEAGADVLCIDSSDGYSEWQGETLRWIKERYQDRVKVGAGNVVDKEGFTYLSDAGADFIKVGIGGGSICITREQKGIGRGQASSLIEVAKARDEYAQKTGIYVPICSDGGIVHDYHMTMALAMGANFVMLGRYFARFDESPSRKLKIGSNFVKEYWGEGSNRARNWERYDYGFDSEQKLEFEEGIDSYVPYAGKLKDNLDISISKMKSTMCNCGATSIDQLHTVAKLTLVSSTSIIEGGAHDVIQKET
jgi:IMP dehydrogenase